MKKYTKPEINVTVIHNESVITLSGTGTQTLTFDKSIKFSELNLNS